jgi:hypothetical protein
MYMPALRPRLFAIASLTFVPMFLGCLGEEPLPETEAVSLALVSPFSVSMTAKVLTFSGGQWAIDKNGNGAWNQCAIDTCATFGLANDIPLTGYWSLGANSQAIGTYRPSTGFFFLDLDNSKTWNSSQDIAANFKAPTSGDQPAVGKWNGSFDTPGIFNNGSWFLDKDTSFTFSNCTNDICAQFGQAGDIAVVGRLGSSSTADAIAVFRNGLWIIDANGNRAWDGCGVDTCFNFGQAGDIPVVGTWFGTGTAEQIGVFRNGEWFLDTNGNGRWDGDQVDSRIRAGDFGVGTASPGALR